MSGAFDKKPEAIVGRLGELAAAEAMQLDGASTIALCRIDTGGAPMLEQGAVRRDALVLPDLQVFNLRALPGAIFVEIKTYATAGTNRSGGFRTHGIPVRLFDHYVANENKTGIPVYLAVNELDTGELRVSDVPLSKLWKDACQCSGCRAGAKHVPGKNGVREAQVYFDRDDFSIVFKHSDKTIERLRREHARKIGGHAWQRHGRSPALPANASFVDRLRRVRQINGLPLDTKVAENDPRDTCADCGATAKDPVPFIAFTVEDALGNERVVCSKCWKESRVA